MSLMERYYDFKYGGLIGQPQPPLSAAQWRTLLKGAWRPVSTVVKLGVSVGCVGLGFIVVALPLRYLMRNGPLVRPTGNPFTDGVLTGLTIGAVQAIICISVFAVFTRVCLRRGVRRAANELGYVRVCVECGYDLRKSKGELCPECGASCR